VDVDEIVGLKAIESAVNVRDTWRRKGITIQLAT